ncbi:MAG: ABC transporter substrate-binding protein [Thermomicrobiales bacterium]
MNNELRLSRRQLTALGLAAIPLTGIPRSAGAQTSAPGWTPAAGLRLAGPSTGLAVLDPALARDFLDMPVLRQIFRGILEFDQDLKAVPALAEKMDVSADARDYTFTLRPDAKFHDGRAVVAADIHASFVRSLYPGTAGGDVSSLAAASYLGGIAGAANIVNGSATTLSGFEVISDRVFTIRLVQPDAAFPLKLASVPASIVDATQSRDALIPNGTGPYAVTAFAPGESLALTVSPTWHGKAPAVSTISFRLGDSASQPLNLFQGGEIDVLDGIPNDQMLLLKDPASGVEIGDIISTSLFSVFYLALSTTVAPLDDIYIRRALQHGFPGAKLATSNAGNVAAARGFLPPGMLGQDWIADIPPYDLDAARQAIAQSRYGTAANVPPIALFGGQTSIADPLHNVGVAMQETAGVELGLTFEPVSVAWSDFVTGLPRRRFSSYSITWIADYPDPESLLWVLFGSDSTENYTGYRNDAFDALLAEARSSLDQTDRIGLYRRAQQMLIDDAVLIPLFFDIGYTAMRPGIVGVPVTPIGMLGLESVSGKE